MTIVVERKVRCTSAPPALWCVITDTERLNRAVGLGRIDLTPNDDDTAARYIVDTVSGGFPLQYEERPYEWKENERFRVRREVRKGAVELIDNCFELEARDDGGTDVTVRITIEPRFLALSPIVKLQTARFVKRVTREIANIDASLAKGRPAGFGDDGQRIHAERLERACSRLLEQTDDAERQAAKKLRELLRTEPDAVVDRIRPFELADRWRLDDRAVLSACLNAVEAGLLELRWDLICPSCRTASDRLHALSELGDEGHCQLCDISYDLSLDRAVEATFRPAPGVRELDAGPYCTGGPARTPHVVAQAILPPGGKVVMQAPNRGGAHRLFVRGGATALIEVKQGAAHDATIDVSGVAGDMGELELAPGAEIVVRQREDAERHVKLERVGWKSRAATAAVVSTLPEFRRLFSGDVLRAGKSLKVGRVALMFTDLTASTQLYRDVGDAGAFRIVQDHFDLVAHLVAQNRGTIVKTMGDAVMAVFLAEADAIRCAAEIHRAFPSFRRERDAASDCYVKIGVYSGPCYAVTANGILDYFGQTVNVTARLQAKAGAGEIVMTEQTWTELGVSLVEPSSISEFEAQLKGVGTVKAVRVRIDDP
jgi:class 3 adenylate cyclase